MSGLLIYSSRHIKEQIHNLQENNYLIVDDEYSIKDWSWYMKYKNIDIHINKITIKDFLEGALDKMKFDYIVGNPPYQMSVGPNKTQQIWATLTNKFYVLLKDKGTMTLVHPGGWRFSTDKSQGDIKKVREIYNSNKVTYAEFNNYDKGKETFSASTDYDVMTIVKGEKHGITEVVTGSAKEHINFNDYTVIPTDKISLFNSLKAKTSEEKVDLLYSRSSYSTDKKRTSQDKDSVFKYPVVYGIPQTGPKYFYSNTKDKGHFGVPKLIIGRAGYTTILDIKGEYGMTQFASAMVDTPENLIKIQKALDLSEFKILKKYFCGLGSSINKNSIIDAPGTMFKFMKEFRKDFWKEFYTTDMEKELIQEGVLDEDGKYTG